MKFIYFEQSDHAFKLPPKGGYLTAWKENFMSDVNKALEGIRLTLKEKSKWYFFGTLGMYVGILLLALGVFIIGKTNSTNPALIVLGVLIALVSIGYQGWPVLRAILFGGGLGNAITGPLKADYEVVTVDGSGNVVSSDGGSQSIMTNFLGKFILFFVVYFFSGTVIGIQTLFLAIKGLILTAKAPEKPTNQPSIKFLFLKNVLITAAPALAFAALMVVGIVFLGGAKLLGAE
jgi:hypothetical protein